MSRHALNGIASFARRQKGLQRPGKNYLRNFFINRNGCLKERPGGFELKSVSGRCCCLRHGNLKKRNNRPTLAWHGMAWSASEVL